MRAAHCSFASQRRRSRGERCHLEGPSDSRLRPGSKLRGEIHLYSPPGCNVEDVAVSKGRLVLLPLFQAKGLGTELDMVVEPITLSPVLIFYGNEPPFLLAYYVSKARKVQRLT